MLCFDVLFLLCEASNIIILLIHFGVNDAYVCYGVARVRRACCYVGATHNNNAPTI